MNANGRTSGARGAPFDMEEAFNLLMEGVSDYIAIHTLSGEIVSAGAAAARGLGLDPETGDAPSPNMTFFLASPPALIIKNAWKSLTAGRPFTAEGVVRRSDGSSFRALLSSRLLTGVEEPLILTIARDLAAAETAEAGASAPDMKDPITGLLNGSVFEDELKRLDQDRQLPVSVIVGALNGIDIINDAFGRQVGDSLLKAAARMLRKVCRSCDLIFRRGLGGFVILLPQTKEAHAAGIAERIENTFREMQIKDLTVSPSISTGYSAKLNRWQDIFNVVDEAEEDMLKKKSSEGPAMRVVILKSILSRLAETTPESPEHLMKVRQISRALGRLAGLEAEELEPLDLAAYLHDIGKVSLPAKALCRPGPLTAEEWEEVRRHPETGYTVVLAAINAPSAADGILSHHERWDGSGYPYGLRGDRIPPFSRIIALADSFDIMTRGAPYRAAMPPEEAFREIEMQSGRQFDPELASLMLKNRELFEDRNLEKLPPVRKFSVE